MSAPENPAPSDELRRESRSGGSMVDAWRGVTALTVVPRRRLVVLASVGATIGVLEVAFLALFASAAVSVGTTEGDTAIKLPVGSVPDVAVSTLLIGAAGVALASIAAQMYLNRATARLVTELTSTMRLETFRDYLASRWEVQSMETVGGFLQFLQGHVGRASLLLAALVTQLTAAFTGAVFVIGALIFAPVVAVTMVVVGAVLLLAFRPLQRRARAIGQASAAANRQFFTTVVDILFANRDIKAFRVGDRVQDRLSTDIEVVEELAYKSQVLAADTPVMYQKGAFLIVLGALAILDALAVDQLATIAASFLLVMRALQQGRGMQSARQVISESTAPMRELIDKRQYFRDNTDHSGQAGLDAVSTIEFDRVSYRYPDGTLAVDDVSFSAHRGELIGLIGPSGSGKSTLSEIVSGLRDPSSGSFRVNGVPAAQFAREAWARSVATVPQTGQLLPGSIESNIAFLRYEISRDSVITSAARAHLSDEIAALDDGFETVVGERGERGLSGGQRQRVAIARALAGNPTLVVLDEPTSALDHKAEETIVETIERLRETACVVVVAHRLSTLRHCDRVLVLNHGKIEAYCPLSELSEQSLFYAAADETVVPAEG